MMIGHTDSPPDSPHTQLGLMHLKKLFNEYTHPKEPLNETERDFKLYNMLPLFCKVSENSERITKKNVFDGMSLNPIWINQLFKIVRRDMMLFFL